MWAGRESYDITYCILLLWGRTGERQTMHCWIFFCVLWQMSLTSKWALPCLTTLTIRWLPTSLTEIFLLENLARLFLHPIHCGHEKQQAMMSFFNNVSDVQSLFLFPLFLDKTNLIFPFYFHQSFFLSAAPTLQGNLSGAQMCITPLR